MLSNARVQRSTEERGGGPFKIRAEVYNIPKKLFLWRVVFFFVGARLTVAPLPLFRTGVAEEVVFFSKKKKRDSFFFAQGSFCGER